MISIALAAKVLQSCHESWHARVNLANLWLEEQKIPNAVSFHAGTHDPPSEAVCKHSPQLDVSCWATKRISLQLTGFYSMQNCS